MRLRPINMAIQPAARRPHVFMELLFCSLRNTSCTTRWRGVRIHRVTNQQCGSWGQRIVPYRTQGDGQTSCLSLPVWLKNMNARSMALVHGLAILPTAAVHMGHFPPFWMDSLKHMLVLGEALALNPRTLLAVSGPLTPTVPSYSVGCTFVPHFPWFSFWPINADILCLLRLLCPGPHAPHILCACTQT